MSELETLHASVVKRTEDYKAARDREIAARSAEIFALKQLNEAQRALDKALADIKKSSPLGSDWNQYERHKAPA